MKRQLFSIGGYTTTKLEPIGRGSFAEVFKGEEALRGGKRKRQVAIKVVDIGRLTGNNRKLMEHLQSEIDLTKNLRHPHIIEHFDVISESQRIYMILEFADRGDLASYLRKHTEGTHKFNEHAGKARYFLRQLVSGLRFLRARHIIHRDLKPQNLLLSSQGVSGAPLARDCDPRDGEALVLKIADFGFARLMTSQSMADTLCGSPLYMAPEILRFEAYTDRADLWSVGAIAYEMLSGAPPFRAANPLELQRMHERSPRKVKLPTNVEISSAASELISSLLCLRAEDRVSWNELFSNIWLDMPPIPAAHSLPLEMPARTTATSMHMHHHVVGGEPSSAPADFQRRGRSFTTPALQQISQSVKSRPTSEIAEFERDAVLILSEERDVVQFLEKRRNAALAVAALADLIVEQRHVDALSLYIRALHLLRQSLDSTRSVSTPQQSPRSASTTTTSARKHSAPAAPGVPLRISIARASLVQTFQDILRTATGVRDDIRFRSNSSRTSQLPSVSCSSHLMYDFALQSGREAAVAELMNNTSKAKRLYAHGLALLEILREQAVSSVDQAALDEYITAFQTRKKAVEK